MGTDSKNPNLSDGVEKALENSTTGRSPSDDQTTPEKLLGKSLQSWRIEADRNILSVSSESRIAPALIEALESGDHSRLPGKTFIKGFSKTLTKIYGKDPALVDVILRSGVKSEIDRTDSGGKNALEVSTKKKITEDDGPKTFEASFSQDSLKTLPFKPLLATVISLTLVASLFLTLVDDTPEESITQMGSEKSSIATDKTENYSSAPGSRMTSNGSGQESVPQTGSSPASSSESNLTDTSVDDENLISLQPGREHLEFLVEEKVKVKIDIDGKRLDRKEFLPGKYRFSFEEEARFYTENGSAVSVTYNGQEIGYLSKSPAAKTIRFLKEPKTYATPQTLQGNSGESEGSM